MLQENGHCQQARFWLPFFPPCHIPYTGNKSQDQSSYSEDSLSCCCSVHGPLISSFSTGSSFSLDLNPKHILRCSVGLESRQSELSKPHASALVCMRSYGGPMTKGPPFCPVSMHTWCKPLLWPLFPEDLFWQNSKLSGL